MVDSRQILQNDRLIVDVTIDPSLKITPLRLDWGPTEGDEIKYFEW